MNDDEYDETENAARHILAVMLDGETDEFNAWYKPEQWLGIHRAVAGFLKVRFTPLTATPIWDQLAEIGAKAPIEAWQALDHPVVPVSEVEAMLSRLDYLSDPALNGLPASAQHQHAVVDAATMLRKMAGL